MLRSVSEESGCTLEVLAADRQPDLRRFLNVAYPLAVHVRCADVELVAVKNEPDRDLVGLPGLASTMSQSRGLLSRYPASVAQVRSIPLVAIQFSPSWFRETFSPASKPAGEQCLCELLRARFCHS